MKTVNLKARVLFPLALTLALTLGLLMFALGEEYEDRTELELVRTVQALEGYYQALLEGRSQKLIAMLNLIADDIDLRNTFKTADRAALLDYTSAQYQRIATRQELTHFYFHTPQRVNLLRVHQPERYGDTINRVTLLDAESSGQTRSGVELDPLGVLTLRVVSPIWEQGRLLGYIELAEEVDHLIRNMAPVFGVELFVAIEKRFLKRADWESGLSMLGHDADWDQYPDSVITLKTYGLAPGIISTALVKRSEKSRSGEPGMVAVNWHDRFYWIGSIELLDAGDQQVGELLVSLDMTARNASNQSTLVLIGVGALLLGIVLISCFYFVLDRAEDALITRWQVWRGVDGSQSHDISVKKLLITLVIVVFIAELVIMVILPQRFSMVEVALIDASLLIVILIPAMYLFIVRPAIQQSKKNLRLKRVARRIGCILEHSSDEIYLFDTRHFHFIDASRSTLDHLGYTMEAFKQLTPIDLKPEFTLEKFEALIEPLRTGEQQRLTFETVHQCKDGTRYPVEVSLLLSRQEMPPVFVALIKDISESKRYIEELEHSALYDSLTGLPNRVLLHDRLHYALRAAKRESQPLAVIMIDIVRLSDVNDILGYGGGDLVLREIAARLHKSLRGYDTLARLGGDEFVIMMPKVSAEQIKLSAEKIQNLFEQTVTVGGSELGIEVISGIALYPDHGDEPNILLQRANIALRVAKKEVLNFSVYDPKDDPHSLRQLKLFGELRQALKQKDLFLYYQPQIDIKTNRIKGVEALARWRHPVEGMIGPGDFIPMVEQSGLIKPFTLWVLDEAIRQIKSWSQQGINLTVAVNLSVRNLLDQSFPDAIAGILENHGVGVEHLVLEVTESAIMTRPESALIVLRKLHHMGFRLSLDDFGTGYSSLSYLKKFPLSEVKIDQSFVASLVTNKDDAIIVRSIIDLAQNMQLEVVGEGVEDEHILARLGTLGCDIAQGNFISRPQSAREIEKLMVELSFGT